MDEEWSVVGKKEKKGSPKAQKSKGVKRTELQRSSSMNQVNSRRKLEANKSVRIDKEDTAKLIESEGAKSTRKSSRLTKTGEDAVANVTESTAAAQDTITTIIDDVSSGIKRLSIDNRPTKAQIDATKYSALVGAEPRAALLKVMSTTQFCELCRHFNPTRPATGRFIARGLLNTGCVCFWNCIMQSLFSITPFRSLLLELLGRLSSEQSKVNERLHAWKEVLTLAAEFQAHSPAAAPQFRPVAVISTSASTPVSSAARSDATTSAESVSEKGIELEVRQTRSMASSAPSAASTPSPESSMPPSVPASVGVSEDARKGKMYSPSSTRSAHNSPVAATNLMPRLFETFQRQMDGISGIHRDYTTVGSKNANKKNGQQDAVEFLTFLLDTLHEEIIRVEAEDALKPELLEPSAGFSDSPLLRAASTMSIGDLARADSLEMEIALTRQNSLSVDAHADGSGQQDDEGWSTVSKNTRTAAGKVKSVVDRESKERASAASKASVISQLFHSTLRSEVVYKQKKVNSVTFQQSHCLTLDVAGAGTGANSASVELETCLANYFAEESIDEGKVRKQIKLDSLPEVLILQLARFSYDYNKNLPIKIQRNVEYPTKLELNPKYLSDELKSRISISKQASSSYQLQAVVMHHGKKATGGHYSTFTLDTQAVDSGDCNGNSAGGNGVVSQAKTIPGLPPAAAVNKSGATGNANGTNNTAAKIAATAATTVTSSTSVPQLRQVQVWRSVNDSKISVINESQALGAQDSAYILFYGKVR